jgi:hypothetical protein
MSDDESIGYIKAKLDDVSDTVTRIDKDVAAHRAAFDQHTADDKDMFTEFVRMNDILSQNTASLREHMHRTDLLEAAVLRMDERISPMEVERLRKGAVNDWIKSKLWLVSKVLAAITTVGGVLALAKQFIH